MSCAGPAQSRFKESDLLLRLPCHRLSGEDSRYRGELLQSGDMLRAAAQAGADGIVLRRCWHVAHVPVEGDIFHRGVL